MKQFRVPAYDGGSFLSWLVEGEDFATNVPATRIAVPEGSVFYRDILIRLKTSEADLHPKIESIIPLNISSHAVCDVLQIPLAGQLSD